MAKKVAKRAKKRAKKAAKKARKAKASKSVGNAVTKMPDQMAETLTARELAFVKAYVCGPRGVAFNATASAKKAGYSNVSAAVLGSRLLRKVHIREAVRALLGDLGVNESWVLREILRDANRDLSIFEPFLTGKKTLKQLRMAGVDCRVLNRARIRRRITGSGRGKKVIVEMCEIELVDRQHALDSLMRALGVGVARREEEREGTAIPTVSVTLIEEVRTAIVREMQKPLIPGGPVPKIKVPVRRSK